MPPMSAEERMTMSVSLYLALERESDLKHEYINGVAYAMAGASRTHNMISASLLGRPPTVDDRSLTNPRVVFEVLSPSTTGFDRGAKADHYQLEDGELTVSSLELALPLAEIYDLRLL